ncbi:uncharacterized protein LOC132303229 [Cornus florida]|uniref:uncharacterized protein LOC132303229 n=1 Tax=Cornus florida TaxID=4283 RepID=UPI00289CC256|nr:uncharacterized protein LOC132303229 [Cornus florida]
MQSSSVLSLSPSFNSYSSCNLAEIAARVVEEFRAESESAEIDDDVFGFKNEESFEDKQPIIIQDEEVEKKKNEEDDNDEFEFAFVCREPNSSPISADDIFYNGQIRPVFPIFNRDLLLGHAGNENSVPPKPPRLPLRKLFIQERETPSCSSSESDELDRIPPGTYCVWKPKAAGAESPGKCKKSNSTGSSKRWKFRDLLHRSNSEGKDTFVFLTPSNSNGKKRGEKVEKLTEAALKLAGELKANGVAADGGVSPAVHYARNRTLKDGDRRRSFLPYRQDIIGFFANVNGLSRNIHPF